MARDIVAKIEKLERYLKKKRIETTSQKNVTHQKNITKIHQRITQQTRLLVSGRSPECSDCLLSFMEQ